MKIDKLQVFLSYSHDPFHNLAIENYLLENNPLGGAFQLLLWCNKPAVIIGRNQQAHLECDMSKINIIGPSLKNGRVHLVRRWSGGGAVYHDFGNSNYSFVMPRDQFCRRWAANTVCNALNKHSNNPLDKSFSLTVNERSDIFWGDCKVSGSAYKLGRLFAYHHGTLLRQTDLNQLAECLNGRNDDDSGIFKGVRSVKSKVANLPGNMEHFEFAKILIDHIHDNICPVEESSIDELDDGKIAEYEAQLRCAQWILHGSSATMDSTLNKAL